MLKLLSVLAIVASGDWLQISVAACEACAKNEFRDPRPDCNPQTCATYNQTIPCPKGQVNKPACRCLKGYARNNNGDCVPGRYCSQCTKANEVYVCPDCSPQTCETRDKIYDCTTTSARCKLRKCTYACRCKRGYFRNRIGECISAEDCGKCTGNNEYFSCGSPCDNVCGNEIGQDNCDINNIQCTSMCYCDKDYARATNGTCIPKEDCQYECPMNEQYETCPDTVCTAKKCTDAGYPLNCTSYSGRCPGKPGCICKENYLRDSSGTCVPSSDCPSCGGDNNATTGCGINCGRLCSNYDSDEPISCIQDCSPNGCDCRQGYVFDENVKKCVLPGDCTPVCGENEFFSKCVNGGCDKEYCSDLNKQDVCRDPKECQYGCLCAKGYLRNKKGKCVKIKNCDNCPPNERYSQCPSEECKARNCSQAGFPLSCQSWAQGNPCPVKPTCVCKVGYLRNSRGKCVASTQCPSCGGDYNATSGCGINCGRLCSNYNSTEPVSCIQECNRNGCDCRNGYVFDTNTNKCVLPEDCTPVCKQNEVFSKCANGGRNKRYCKDLNEPDACRRPKNCKAGCLCADGYLRNKKGVCVPIDDCDNCPANERYRQCPAAECTPKTCSEAGFPLDCPDIDDGDSCPGKPGCICNEGYLRNKNKVCVPSEQCPSCGGDYNATLGCGVNCGRLCSNYDSEDPIFCPLFCFPNSCDCRPDYVYDSNVRKCVLPTDCTPVCGDYEVYTSCVNGGCDKKYCTDLNKPDACMCPDDCKVGCICTNGYLRDSNNTCIPSNQCYKGQ